MQKIRFFDFNFASKVGVVTGANNFVVRMLR